MSASIKEKAESGEKGEGSEYVGIRFEKLGKLWHFRQGDVSVGLEDHVVVETRRGRQLGQVVSFVKPEDVARKKGVRSVERMANSRDMVLQQVWDAKNLDALITCREMAHNMGVREVKFVKSRFNFDGSWLTVSFTTEEKKKNLNPLKNALSDRLKTRVEFQLVGPRDVAKIMGGYGACGGPRCCSTFLTEFSPISIKMAKAQGISLSPNEITGMCGRLRCCLIFEYEQYVEAKKRFPKMKAKVGTPHGDGWVRDVRVLRDSVLIDYGGGRVEEVAREDIEPLAELKALKEKAAGGCTKHEGGGCDCGKKE